MSNDNLANATLLVLDQPSAPVPTAGLTDEPNDASGYGKSAWWEFTPTTTGPYVFDATLSENNNPPGQTDLIISVWEADSLDPYNHNTLRLIVEKRRVTPEWVGVELTANTKYFFCIDNGIDHPTYVARVRNGVWGPWTSQPPGPTGTFQLFKDSTYFYLDDTFTEYVTMSDLRQFGRTISDGYIDQANRSEYAWDILIGELAHSSDAGMYYGGTEVLDRLGSHYSLPWDIRSQIFSRRPTQYLPDGPDWADYGPEYRIEFLQSGFAFYLSSGQESNADSYPALQYEDGTGEPTLTGTITINNSPYVFKPGEGIRTSDPYEDHFTSNMVWLNGGSVLNNEVPSNEYEYWPAIYFNGLESNTIPFVLTGTYFNLVRTATQAISVSRTLTHGPKRDTYYGSNDISYTMTIQSYDRPRYRTMMPGDGSAPAGVRWWTGSSADPANVIGYWDGAQVIPTTGTVNWTV